jgi:hypothetical protein
VVRILNYAALFLNLSIIYPSKYFHQISGVEGAKFLQVSTFFAQRAILYQNSKSLLPFNGMSKVFKGLEKTILTLFRNVNFLISFFPIPFPNN